MGSSQHWPVSASLVHTCKVAATLLQEEQINFIVRIIFFVPQFCKRIHRGILPFQNRWGRPQPFVSERYVCRTQNALLPNVEDQSLQLSCAPRLPPDRKLCMSVSPSGFGSKCLLWICESDTFVLTRTTRTAGGSPPQSRPNL